LSRVFHLTDEFAPESGVTGMIMQLARYLAGQGWASTVCTAAGPVAPAPADVTLKQFPLGPGGWWRLPRGLTSYLQPRLQDPGSVLHLHGVWMGFQWCGARLARRQHTPVVLSPHGMLNGWHFRRRGLKELRKLIYWRTVAAPAFRGLSVIHAVTPREAKELAGWLPGAEIRVIPNALDLAALDALLAQAEETAVAEPEEPYLLSLGRLHPVKGIDLLIAAFARVAPKISGRFRLLIVGPESDPVYAARLKSLVRQEGLEDRVIFRGPVFDPREKTALYRRAWAFCAPSQTEVMGLVNLEAAAARVPGVTTHETGLWDWEAGGGLLVHPRVEDLSRALSQVFAWSEAERQDRGRQLRRLVERRYAWQAVGPQWLELYTGLA
jgi:glycosyltransferase involved in cell wall biosynthesis